MIGLKKIIFVAFISFAFSYGQTISQTGLLDAAFESLVSNVKQQKTVLSTSNIWLSHLDASNTFFIESIKKFPQYFGNDLKKQLEFYDIATHHYFYHLGDKQSKRKAFLMWQALIDIDRQLLEAAGLDLKDISAFKSPLKGQGLDKAFEMERYLYVLKDEPNKLVDIDYRRLEITCEHYRHYYTQGLNYSEELNLNFLVYFLELADYSNAKASYERLETLGDPYYQSELSYLRLIRRTNEAGDEEDYELLKNHLRLMRLERGLKEKPGDKYFNHANAVLFPKNTFGVKPSYRFNELEKLSPEDAKRAMKTYIKALQEDPHRPEANYNLGLLYAKEHNVPKAILYLKRALKYRSSFNTLYSLGLLEMQLKNYQGAYKYFKEAEYYDTNSPSLYNNLSICSKYVKDPDIIKPRAFYINKALALREDDYRLYVTKGLYFRDRGDEKGYTNQIRLALKRIGDIEEKEYTSLEVLELFSVTTAEEVPQAKQKAMESLYHLIGIKKTETNLSSQP